MKVLGALWLLGSAFMAPFASAQIVEGTVVDSVSGAPVGGASVQIENAGKAPYQAVSDAQGAFRVEGVADGSYTAFALKSGYQTLRDEAALRPFRVVAGLDPVELKLSLIPRGRMSGRVLDADNHPVAGADVWLFETNGNGQGATAGANGGFSFELAPGNYFLSARAPVKFAAPAPVGDQHYAWAKTWFPGVTQANEAQKIVIHPGVDLAGQDIQLRAVNAFSIHGQIREPNGDPATKLTIKLTRADDTLLPLERSAASAADGSFEFADLYDGEWRLSAEQNDNVILRAFATVAITGRDANDVELRLAAPFSVPVEIVLETSDSTVKIAGNVFLGPEWGGFSPGGMIDKNGRIEGVYPGRYQVNFVPRPGNYAASIILGDREILGQMTEFSSGSEPLRIVYRADGGSIRGSVENCGNATIAISAEDPALQRGNMGFPRFARCTADGHFEIRDLHPGRYYVSDDASAVDVKAGETTTVELKLSEPRP